LAFCSRAVLSSKAQSPHLTGSLRLHLFIRSLVLLTPQEQFLQTHSNQVTKPHKTLEVDYKFLWGFIQMLGGVWSSKHQGISCLWGWLQRVVRAALLTHRTIPGCLYFCMWCKETREDADKLCQSAAIPRSHAALYVSVGKAVSFPGEYLGHLLPNQRQSGKQNAGGRVLTAHPKISCSSVSETHFPGKMSHLWHSALFASEHKVKKSVSKRLLSISKGSL